MLLVFAALACERGMEEIFKDDHEAELAVSFTTVPETCMSMTRSINEGIVDEGTSPGYEVSDFWLLQYDDAGSLVGSPRYYRMQDYEDGLTASVVLPDSGKEYTCVVLANTHNDQFYKGMGDVTTLDKLKRSHLEVDDETDLYQENGASSKDLLMNGLTVLTSSSTALDFNLFRNVAKVTVDVTNKAGSKVNIKSLQIKNVPDIVCYADQLVDGVAQYPTSSDAEFFDYPIEDFQLDASDSEDQNKTLTFYLPRNVQGITTSATSSGKNNGAPNFATFVEILAEDDINDIPIKYTFYLGGNTTNDFNLRPNHSYTFPITITSPGNPELDSRVESLGRITLSDANSFIVNPLSGQMQPVFQVTTERVNLFWGSADGLASNVLTGASEWVVEVIWQDTDKRVMDFCDANGKIIVDGASEPVDRYEGVGLNSFYFKTRQAAFNESCNVLVGLRLKSDLSEDLTPNYLWSWHLWITSYDPTPVEAASEDKYIYPAKNGGYIHRYADAHGGKVWSTIYKDKFIMDRNLGARSADGTTSKEMTAGFYYQWGRKDPFPYVIPIYDIDGERISWNESYADNPNQNHDPVRALAGPALFCTSVQHPFAFYTKDGVGGDWASGNSYYGLWNNPTWNASSSGKSFFDPCPSGWRLPNSEVWSVFQKLGKEYGENAPINAKIYSGTNYFSGVGYEFYISGIQDDMTADEPTAFYPSLYRRHPYNATVESLQTSTAAYWGCYNTHLYAPASTSQYTRTSSLSTAYPVRCIQE